VNTDQDQPLSNDRSSLTPLRHFVSGIVAGSRAHVRAILVVAAVLAAVGAGYTIGTPSGGTQASVNSLNTQSERSAAGAQAGFSQFGAALSVTKGTPTDASSAAPSAAPAGQDQLAATLDASLIVKTGQMSLEVSDLNSAVSKAQAAVAGMGGYVAQSSRSGSDANASATATYRIPVARWDDALAALRKLGTKVLSEQTDSSDVSSQAIDLDARLANLKTTEAALQGIMARASAIPDVLAVEQQLSTTQGDIEQLTAERSHLGDQAAMSTVAVTFQLPSETVTTETSKGWELGSQVDQAAAQLVRIGQGLATIGVWAVIVGLPVALALLILFLAWRLTRRLLGRGRRAGATPSQA
jgi:Ca-activated chloride channel family protein